MPPRLSSFCFCRVATICLVIVAAQVIAGPAPAREVKVFQIATGSTSGTYFPIGTIIANGVSNPRGKEFCDDPKKCGVPGLLAIAQTTQGSVDNVTKIAKREVESGFSQTDIAYAAFRGEGRFKELGPVRGLRIIANLYTEALHVVSRRGRQMNDLADLQGLRVSLGAPNSGTAVDAAIILKRAGLMLGDIQAQYLSSAAAADALKGGQLDAFFAISGVPSRAVSSLADSIPIRLLPVDGKLAAGLIRDYPYYSRTEIPENSYAEEPATPTIGVGALWLVSAEVSSDLVYLITRALWNDSTRKLLDAGHPKGRSIKLESAIGELPIPLHAGADRYYREVGVLR